MTEALAVEERVTLAVPDTVADADALCAGELVPLMLPEVLPVADAVALILGKDVADVDTVTVAVPDPDAVVVACVDGVGNADELPDAVTEAATVLVTLLVSDDCGLALALTVALGLPLKLMLPDAVIEREGLVVPVTVPVGDVEAVPEPEALAGVLPVAEVVADRELDPDPVVEPVTVAEGVMVPLLLPERVALAIPVVDADAELEVEPEPVGVIDALALFVALHTICPSALLHTSGPGSAPLPSKRRRRGGSGWLDWWCTPAASTPALNPAGHCNCVIMGAEAAALAPAIMLTSIPLPLPIKGDAPCTEIPYAPARQVRQGKMRAHNASECRPRMLA